MIFRESHGLTGTEGLTDLQKRIYEFIKTKSKVMREELAKELALKPGELENEFAILRHSQLLKGRKVTKFTWCYGRPSPSLLMITITNGQLVFHFGT